MDALEVWAKMERSVAVSRATTVAPVSAAADDDPEEKKARRRRILRCLDVAGAVFWVYAVSKVFVADFDRRILQAIAPSVVGLLDYRFFIFLAAAASLAIAARWWAGYVAYILGFPLIVVFWKIPRFLYRRRSWTLLLVGLNAATVVASQFRRNFVIKALAFLAAFVIVVSTSSLLIVPSMIYITLALGYGCWRAIKLSLSPSEFITTQDRIVSRAVKSEKLADFCSITEDLKRDEIEIYTSEQISRFTLGLSVGLVLPKVLHLWAFQLHRYRRTPAPYLFNLLSYLWLFFGSLAALTLLNLGTMHIAPDQFEARSAPSMMAVLMYSLSTMALSAAGDARAVGDWALLIQFGAGVLGPVILVGFLLNTVLTYRHDRDNEATAAAIDALRARAKEREAAVVKEYAVTAEEALERLEQVGHAFRWLLTLISVSIPDDFLDDPIGGSE